MKINFPSALAVRGLVPALLVGLLAYPSYATAQSTEEDHIVTAQTMQQQVENASAAREKNIENLTQFLSTPIAQRAMQDAHFDANKVRTTIPTLSDEELSNLSARATNAQQDFAAGHIGPSLLTLIVVAIVVIIVVAIVA